VRLDSPPHPPHHACFPPTLCAAEMIRLRRDSSSYSTATASQNSGEAPYTATRAIGPAAQRVRTSSGDISASGAAQPSPSAVRHRRELSLSCNPGYQHGQPCLIWLVSIQCPQLRGCEHSSRCDNSLALSCPRKVRMRDSACAVCRYILTAHRTLAPWCHWPQVPKYHLRRAPGR